MSREIKFRAWDKVNKLWYNRVLAGCNCDSDDYICNVVWSQEHKDWIHFDEFFGDVMQFTGLKDKNGVEIYEGDIVRKDGFTPTKVEFYDLRWYPTLISMGCEVIGNIYENPELLQALDE